MILLKISTVIKDYWHHKLFILPQIKEVSYTEIQVAVPSGEAGSANIDIKGKLITL